MLSSAMAIYRLRSFGPTGRIVSTHRLSAANDREALAMAREMVAGASGVAGFDLWDRERRVHGVAPKTKSPRRSG